MNFFSYRYCKAVVAFLATMALSFNSFAISPQIVNSFYNYAHTNQINKIRRLQSMGYGIDVKTDDGVTAYCIAKENDDTQAMRLLVRMGADKNQKCGNGWGKTALIVAGVAAVGGGVALAAGGGGGGSSDPCAAKPNSTWFVDHCQCNPGYLEQNDICYQDLQCGEQAHSTGTQTGDQCVCEAGYTGTLCNDCAGGYIGQNGVCYQDLQCGEQTHSTGEQNGNQCVCETGYTGTLCSDCAGGYIEQNGICYPEIDCGEHGTQNGNQCVCDTGYAGEQCSMCDEGYTSQNGRCYAILNCENQEHSTGMQNGDQCVCETGYAGTLCTECASGYTDLDGSGVCYQELTCGDNQHQEGNNCVCDDGYIDQNGKCYKDLKCEDQPNTTGEQKGNKCVCQEGFGHDGTGACVLKEVEAVVGIDNKANYYDGTYEFINNKYADVYGLTYDVDDPENTVTVGDPDNLYNRYSEIGGEAASVSQNSSIGIVNNSDGNVYGMYSDNATAVYNLYANITASLQGSVSAKIGIENHGDGNVFGIYAGAGDAYNGYYTSGLEEFATELSSSVNITNDGSGVSYGMYSRDGDVNNINSWSSVVVESTYDEQDDVLTEDAAGGGYGLYSTNGNVVNGGVVEVSSASGTAVGLSGKNITNTGTTDVSSGRGESVGAVGSVVDNDGKITVHSDNGDVYGIKWSSFSQTASQTSSNSGTIEVSGSGNTYGYWADGSNSTGFENEEGGVIKGENSGGNLYGMYLSETAMQGAEQPDNHNAGTVDLTSTDGDVYGIYTLESSVTNGETGVIKASVSGNGNVYGINAENTTVTNDGRIEVSGDLGDVYGIYGTNSVIDSRKDIIVNHNNTESGTAYGIYANGGSVTNEGRIEASGDLGDVYGIYGINSVINNAEDIIVNHNNTESGTAYGIYADGESVTNRGTISVSAESGTAYGIYGTNSVINNAGDIIVNHNNTESGTAYGIYADGGSVTNTGEISVSAESGTAYGIYATNGATISNTGTITLNSTACEGTCDGSASNGNYIVLNNGSTLLNAGLLSITGDFDLADYNNAITMARSGEIEATGKVSGEMGVEASVVTGGFEDEYVEEGALKGETIEVSANSLSAMFEASVRENGDGSADVVMSRKSFNELSSGSGIASYLEENYQLANNEGLYDALKTAGTTASYRSAEAELLGYGLLPNFSRENMTVLRSLNDALNEELFTTEGDERKMVGYDYLYQSRDTKGTLTGYENYANTMYFMYDRALDSGVRSGIGMSITQLSSNYDDDSSRKEIMVQALVPVSYETESGVKWASVARFGYGDGEYKRRTSTNVYESDLSEWIYGLSNALRYEIDLGYATVEPMAEFNVLGYYQNRIREDKNKANAIKADAENNLSVEGGIGLGISKEWKLNERDKLKVHARAMYYHEFAEPYHSLDASIYGMSGSYRITDYEGLYDDDRGVISAGLDYDIGDFTIYGQYNQYIEDENPMSVNVGLKYRF